MNNPINTAIKPTIHNYQFTDDDFAGPAREQVLLVKAWMGRHLPEVVTSISPLEGCLYLRSTSPSAMALAFACIPKVMAKRPRTAMAATDRDL